MVGLLIRILLLALIFGSVDAAVDAAHVDSDHVQDASHVIHEHNGSQPNVDEDSCDHYCHCAQQIGALYSSMPQILLTHVIDGGSYHYHYRYQPLPFLLRPPII